MHKLDAHSLISVIIFPDLPTQNFLTDSSEPPFVNRLASYSLSRFLCIYLTDQTAPSVPMILIMKPYQFITLPWLLFPQFVFFTLFLHCPMLISPCYPFAPCVSMSPCLTPVPSVLMSPCPPLSQGVRFPLFFLCPLNAHIHLSFPCPLYVPLSFPCPLYLSRMCAAMCPILFCVVSSIVCLSTFPHQFMVNCPSSMSFYVPGYSLSSLLPELPSRC